MTSSTDDPLVTTDWLAAHIDDPKVKVIDASFKLPGVLPLPVDDYLAAHIPGAVFFDVDAISDHNNPRPHMFPDAAQFARDIAALGISSGDTVVAYDSGGWVAAPRAWWMFLSFGHPNVKVLDGGLKKWTREGRPTHSGKVTPKPGKFTAKLDPSYIRSQQQVLANIETQRRAIGRCATAWAFRRYRSGAAAGIPFGSHSRQPQRALCGIVRPRDRRDEVARRIAHVVHGGRARPCRSRS